MVIIRIGNAQNIQQRARKPNQTLTNTFQYLYIFKKILEIY